MVKRYLCLKNSMICKLPPWFYNHEGKKWISVVSFTFINYDSLRTNMTSFEDIELHADFVMKDDTLNGYLCNSGNTIHKRPKWEIFTDQKEIHFRMYPMDGETMTWNESSHAFTDATFTDSYFIIQLLLETKD